MARSKKARKERRKASVPMFKKGHKRIGGVEYYGVDEQPVPPQWKRLSKGEYNQVTTIGFSGKRHIPDINNRTSDKVKLLRLKEEKKIPSPDDGESTLEVSAEHESFIIDSSEMLNMMNDVNSAHRNFNDSCDPEFEYKSVKKQGVCCIVTLRCKKCEFTSSPYKLFQEIKTGKRGQKAAIPNVALQIALQDTMVGNESASYILSMMGVAPPNRSIMQRQANRIGEGTVELNKADMAEIRENLKKILRLRNEDDQSINIQGDGRYNSLHLTQRNKMGRCASTMTGLFVENMTDDHKIIGVEVKSKLCWIGAAMRAKGFEVKCGATGATVDERHKNCTANFPEYEAFREYDLGAAIGASLAGEGTRIEHMTTDGDASAFKGLNDSMKEIVGAVFRDVKHQQDVIHLHQAQTRAGHKAEFSAGMFPGRTAEARKMLKNTFLRDLRIRSSKVLKALFKEFNGDVTKIANELYDTVITIVQCYDGDCKDCADNKFSLCSGLEDDDTWWAKSNTWTAYSNETPKFEMTDTDRNLVQLILEMTLSKDALEQLRLGISTQRTESYNRSLSASDPKIVTRSRNSIPRIHSAVHRVNNNIARSAEKKLKWFNISTNRKSRATKSLFRIADNREYSMKYRQGIRHQKLSSNMKNLRAKDYYKHRREKNYRNGGDYKKHTMISIPDLRKSAVKKAKTQKHARQQKRPVPEWKCQDPQSRYYDHSYFRRTFKLKPTKTARRPLSR